MVGEGSAEQGDNSGKQPLLEQLQGLTAQFHLSKGQADYEAGKGKGTQRANLFIFLDAVEMSSVTHSCEDTTKRPQQEGT